ncbi:MAG: hypothetical protein IPM53_28670 [Anaerolineaceae bacterium]|nr:hypothetical protein [Anaerolineaceae bacterium]
MKELLHAGERSDTLAEAGRHRFDCSGCRPWRSTRAPEGYDQPHVHYNTKNSTRFLGADAAEIAANISQAVYQAILKPYPTAPQQQLLNHGWIIGGEETISWETQTTLDVMLDAYIAEEKNE